MIKNLSWVSIDWEKQPTCSTCGLKRCMCCSGCQRHVHDCTCPQRRPPRWRIQEILDTLASWGQEGEDRDRPPSIPRS